MLLTNALIHDAVHPVPYSGAIRIQDTKIAAIGPDLTPLPGEMVTDLGGKHIYPGFVEAHSHLGLQDYGMGVEGHDLNESGDMLSPHLRGLDGFYPQDRAIPMALAGGVTTVGTGPGSANILGGTFVVVKTYGQRVDDMAIVPEAAMKCAFGENPKRCYRDRGNCTRMTTAAKLREMLFRTREYLARKKAAGDDATKRPAFDMKLEALIPVVEKRMPLKAHAHRADDICTAIRIAKEFDLAMTIEHCTEGHLVVDELVRAGFPVAVGPSLTNAGKIELANKTFETPAILARAGLQVSIITDAPVIPQQYLPLCAGLAVKAGMDPFMALQSITINPAKHLGVAGRVGSLETGKDADIVVADGDPMMSGTNILTVYLDGKRVIG